MGRTILATKHPMDWLDAHSGSMVALATVVLVIVTGYYAWVSRQQVRETRTILLASARSELQGRMDRISEIMIREPGLMALLDDETATGAEEDARFHVANMFLGVLEEAHTQYAIERSMPEDDWSAWVATADVLLRRRYMASYWRRVHATFEPGFQRFVDSRVQDT
jgi:hypothetical protein